MTAFLLKKISSNFPLRTQQSLKRRLFAHQIRSGTFITDEPEYARLDEWVGPGDWVMDVGANVGHYSVRLASLVGTEGRVLAFEPVPETFDLLAANIATAGARNVSLFNVAASEEIGVVNMSIPNFASGLANYYRAAITSEVGGVRVPALALDCVAPSVRVALIKIDVEGHEYQALRGMRGLLRRDFPRLIIEGGSGQVESFLAELGYSFLQLDDSPNRVFSKIG